jgi:hypothetical protein
VWYLCQIGEFTIPHYALATQYLGVNVGRNAMPARKQFLNTQPAGERLEELLAKARKTPVSEEMLREQRISFAFGNALENEDITKESVREMSNRLSVRA